MIDLFDSANLPVQRKAISPLTVADIVDIGSDAFIPDWRVAQLLGFKQEFNIRQLIARHSSTLETRGKLLRDTRVLGSRGPAAEVYLLNRKQALFLIAQSGAPNAGPVLLLMIDVFDAWLSGKLQPVDIATANQLADSTATAFQNAPEIMQILQDQQNLINQMLQDQQILAGRVATDDRLASVQRTQLEIQDRINQLKPRRGAPVINREIYDRVVLEYNMGRCPCCQRPDRIIISDDGSHTGLYHEDHVTDNPYNNALGEMWPVCKYCNGKLKHDKRYRRDQMNAFWQFQSHVQEVLGNQQKLPV